MSYLLLNYFKAIDCFLLCIQRGFLKSISNINHDLKIHEKILLLFCRLIWTALLVFASVSILVQFYVSWDAYSQSSIQIVVDDPRFPLSKIDFPAITICSVNKILYSKAKKLILEYNA